MKISPKLIRIIQTININASVFCMGMLFSAHGTALLDLAEVFEATVEVISYTLTSRAAGSILGGLVGGTLFRCFNAQLVVTACLLLCGTAVALIPSWPNILFLHALSFLIGCWTTLCEIGGHVWLQIIWKDKSGPQIQLYNLMFGVGGIIAPFICEPFLSSRILPLDPSAAVTEAADIIAGTNHSNIVPTTTSSTDYFMATQSASRIHIAYAMLGTIFILNSLSFLLSYKLDSTDMKPDKDPETMQDELPKKSKYIIVTLLAIYMLLGVADEITLTAFLPTFVVRNKYLQFTKSEAAFLSSAFWLSYTLSRLLATILSFRFSPGKIIVFFHTILMTASLGMLALVNTSPVFAWIGSVMVSFGLSPFFGNATIWGVQYILLSHKYMSILMVCVCVGAMAPSALIGQVIDTQPMIMMWSHVGLATALTICACVLLMYGRTHLLREFEQKKLDKKKAESTTLSTSAF